MHEVALRHHRIYEGCRKAGYGPGEVLTGKYARVADELTPPPRRAGDPPFDPDPSDGRCRCTACREQTCQVCREPLDNLAPGISVVEKKPPYGVQEQLTICGNCRPAMLHNGWKEV